VVCVCVYVCMCVCEGDVGNWFELVVHGEDDLWCVYVCMCVCVYVKVTLETGASWLSTEKMTCVDVHMCV
jgi:hypothetical protein